MALTYRGDLTRPLTTTEIDGNFAHFTGSHAITGSLVVSGSPAITTQGTLTVTGTNATLVLPYTSASQPTSPLTGSMYFDYAQNLLYVYNGTAWKSSSLV
jgi:hypothetical protein